MFENNQFNENECKNTNDELIELHSELDEEAVDVIFRLYNRTFEDLVNR